MRKHFDYCTLSHENNISVRKFFKNNEAQQLLNALNNISSIKSLLKCLDCIKRATDLLNSNIFDN